MTTTSRERRDTIQWTRVRVRVVGLVQGVSYRKSAQAEATGLELSGWVRNEPDGSVTLEIEGTERIVDTMVQWCRQGPPGARVDDVVVLKMTAACRQVPFEIRA